MKISLHSLATVFLVVTLSGALQPQMARWYAVSNLKPQTTAIAFTGRPVPSAGWIAELFR